MQFTDQTHEFLSLILDSETEKGMSLLYKTFLPPRPYTPLPIPARNSNTPATSSRPYPAYVKLMSQTFLKEIL